MSFTLLNTDLGGVRFGIDDDGNYGYKKVGADTVIPFNKKLVIKVIGQSNSYDAHSWDVRTLVPDYKQLTSSNFFISACNIGFFYASYTCSETQPYDVSTYNPQTGIVTVSQKRYYWTRSDNKVHVYINYTLSCCYIE